VAGKLLVVVVEDDSALRALVMQILRGGLDAEVLGAGDGEHGLRLVASVRPCILLLDIEIPQLHGLEVVRRLRADPSFAGLPILGMSGSAAAEDALAAGCDAFIHKPFRAEALTAAIRDLLPEA
jgi:CheY-like chemotaxis protein